MFEASKRYANASPTCDIGLLGTTPSAVMSSLRRYVQKDLYTSELSWCTKLFVLKEIEILITRHYFIYKYMSTLSVLE